MGPHTVKRRKLSHTSSDEDAMQHSDASDNHSSNELEHTDQDSSDAGHFDEDDNGAESGGSNGESDDSASDVDDAPKKQDKKQPAQQRKKRQAYEPQDGVYTAEVYKSNIFKLQVDDLLEQVRPKYGKQEAPAENALRTLKTIIEQIPSKEPLTVPNAERELIKSSKVAIPFPNPRPPKDAKYKLEYTKPANVTVGGSYPLKLASRTDEELAIDLVVTMPSKLFQEKDFLNYRYFYKRAYYVACIAAGISGSKHKFNLAFEYLNGNQLQPILIVRGSGDGGPDDFSSSKCRINVLITIPEGVFPLDKTMPARNCVRPKAETEETTSTAAPTPFYNASLRADSSMIPYLKLFHSASRQSDAYADACLLGRVWLRQRGFSGNVCSGGFGNFEWAAMMALLLQGGNSGGKPILSAGYSSYQLFKATLQYLASKDLTKSPLLLQAKDVEFPKGYDLPVLFDGTRGLNILFKMTPWSYKRLRQTATTSIRMLGDTIFDQFEPTLILREDSFLYKYDITLELPINSLGFSTTDEDAEDQLIQQCRKLYTVLLRGLGNRVTQISLTRPKQREWAVGSRRYPQKGEAKLLVGFAADAANIGRSVDHGPSAENKKEAASFRQFWGEKAELRRFKDGSILESLVWSTKESNTPIFQQIVDHLLRRHINKQAADSAKYIGHQIESMLPTLSSNNVSNLGTTQFQPLMNAFATLEKDLRSLEDMPLSLRHVLASDACLSYASIDVPLLHGSKRMTKPAEVVIQFEGSARWPDDLVAIQRTKIAFLLRISQLLTESNDNITARVGLENEGVEIQNQGFLDIIYPTGPAFRLRIFHDREQTLLERRAKDPVLDASSKEAAGVALGIYKRDFVRRPMHTQTIQTLSTRFPALSPTIRLLKKWFSGHLLTPHIAPEIVDLLAARAFLQPYPWDTPNSAMTGFLRAILFLSRWDWRRTPLIIDFSGHTSGSGILEGALKSSDLAALSTRFTAWRKLDPALNRVVLFAASSVDPEGTTWTDHAHPAKVVAARMTQLAKAASDAVAAKGLDLDPETIFHSSTADYDILLHLNPRFTRAGQLKHQLQQKRLNEAAAFKNLQLQAAAAAVASSSTGRALAEVGYDPVSLFLTELDAIYGNALVWFYDNGFGDDDGVVAALWNVTSITPRPWKVKLPYSSVPLLPGSEKQKKSKQQVEDDETSNVPSVIINKAAILAEIARLGGDLILKVEVLKN